ncbi:MAG: DUF364 domain-containing protein [Pseudomonadota bacterium]|nr:DUF364 domain-containing protein [Pseudomonadota bacterium]
MNPWAVYELLWDRLGDAGHCRSATLGLVWTLCEGPAGMGLAMTAAGAPRTLPWPGTLAGRPLAELARWLERFQPHEATLGLAAVNAVINGADNSLRERACPIRSAAPGNLAVFGHFLPQLQGQRVIVIGRYPGLDRLTAGLDVTVLERQPGPGDLPDPACEYLLPEADWVFLTASTLANKTFPRLASLAVDATTVLMGPSAPWLAELAQFGIDYLAGVVIDEPDLLRRTVAEGGGTRLFDGPLHYRLARLGPPLP